ncbi:Carbonyl reductase family member 4 [Ceratocystis fimbriata CBS 114723]|uniref:Carbonyl reductase family member 4 n=1 Tax=Ceratocystis fimbriata CBS 114723 TaxID=1035309 RepID=A0A2C5X749_9PEZI|nr:Carbonyl reductase family member 4 [Ceratocystis fimbriata CBS 114723]
MPIQSLAGKHAVITGATGALGFAIAKHFIGAGIARITLLGRRIDALNQASLALSQVPHSGVFKRTEGVAGRPDIQIQVHAVDVAKPEALKEAARQITTVPTHFLVNAAGIAQNSLLMRAPEEDLLALVNTNLVGTMLACKYFSRGLSRASDGGDSCIINISSLLALLGGRGASAYAASKAGVLGLTRSLSMELGAQGVRVNALVPGYIESKMVSDIFTKTSTPLIQSIPLKRLGTVDEVAHAALFLVQNKYANNCVLNLDGGLSAGIV